MEKKEVSHWMTPVFTLEFPKVFTPKKGANGGKDKYKITMVFDNEKDLEPLKKMAMAALKEKFGPKMDNPKFKKSLRWPFKKGTDGEDTDIDTEKWPHFTGKFYCDANSEYAPGIVDNKRQEIIDPSQIYRGAKCKAAVNVYTFDTDENKGVGIGLMALQKWADGDRLGGGPVDAASLFDSVETEEVELGSADDDSFDDLDL